MSARFLSKNDSAVLGALFDPEASLQNNIYIDPNAPSLSFNLFDLQTQLAVQQQEKDALFLINTENPSQADIQTAITRLDAIIQAHPEYASAYNNRAQAGRMLIPEESLFDRTHSTALESIMADLSRAISLVSPEKAMDRVSASQAQVLASAHTHRGYLLWRASRSSTSLLIPEFADFDKDQLEEMASRDFAIGGRYGNRTAQTLAVKTNPYAKLCGSIVKEALRKEVEDYQKQHQFESQATSEVTVA